MSSLVARWAKACFALDLRSLAVMRIALGVLVIVDVVVRSLDVGFFYTDDGVLPRSLVTWRTLPTLYMASGNAAFVYLMLTLTALAGLALAVGWRPRAAALACWVLVLSIQNRNHYVNTGADGVLISLLLWSCFLPLGARFSVDAWRRPQRAPSESTAVTWATVALVLQLFAIYVFNALNKNHGAWWSGDAVLIALHNDQHATALGVWVREHAAWLAAPLTWYTLLIEAAVALLLVPWRTTTIRSVLFAGCWALHLGFIAFMELGLFGPVCMVAWLALLPSSLWERRPFANVAKALQPATPTALAAARLSRPASALVGALIALQLAYNALFLFDARLPSPLARLATMTRSNQRWRMFAPSPGTNDGWFVIVGKLRSGNEVDLFRDVGGAVSRAKPRVVTETFATVRWQKLMMNNANQDKKNDSWRRSHARWLCRRWNEEHHGDDEVATVRYGFMLERTLVKPRVRPEAPKELILLEHACGT